MKKKSKMSLMKKREARNGILFILPWIIGLLAFTLYPILASLYYSFCNYNVIKPPTMIGFANYVNLFKDKTFLKALSNTAYMILIGVPVTTFFAVLISVLLNYKGLKYTSGLRIAFFIPTLVPTVVACLLWVWVMQPESGIVNRILGYIGIKGPGWVSDPKWAKPAFILLMIWTCGNAIIIYLAGLQDISPALYDAAEALYGRILPPNDPYMAAVCNNRGLLLRAQGRREEAYASFLKALAVLRECADVEAETAATRLNLASVSPDAATGEAHLASAEAYFASPDGQHDIHRFTFLATRAELAFRRGEWAAAGDGFAATAAAWADAGGAAERRKVLLRNALYSYEKAGDAAAAARVRGELEDLA